MHTALSTPAVTAAQLRAAWDYGPRTFSRDCPGLASARRSTPLTLGDIARGMPTHTVPDAFGWAVMASAHWPDPAYRRAIFAAVYAPMMRHVMPYTTATEAHAAAAAVEAWLAGGSGADLAPAAAAAYAATGIDKCSTPARAMACHAISMLAETAAGHNRFTGRHMATPLGAAHILCTQAALAHYDPTPGTTYTTDPAACDISAHDARYRRMRALTEAQYARMRALPPLFLQHDRCPTVTH